MLFVKESKFSVHCRILPMTSISCRKSFEALFVPCGSYRLPTFKTISRWVLSSAVDVHDLHVANNHDIHWRLQSSTSAGRSFLTANFILHLPQDRWTERYRKVLLEPGFRGAGLKLRAAFFTSRSGKRFTGYFSPFDTQPVPLRLKVLCHKKWTLHLPRFRVRGTWDLLPRDIINAPSPRIRSAMPARADALWTFRPLVVVVLSALCSHTTLTKLK